MRVFVARSTGAIGRFLVPDLVEIGHEVIGLARSDQKGKALEAMGAKFAVADALNKEG
jgi:2-alkyl-3-oxoalkanoate reductase